jgi:hypothetical protein
MHSTAARRSRFKLMTSTAAENFLASGASEPSEVLAMRNLTCMTVIALLACGASQSPAPAPLAAPQPPATPVAALPEAGPEDGGMRLRLVVAPPPAAAAADAGKEGYDVRLDLLNTSRQPITLLGKWRNEDVGDIKAYLEAATSIECVPDVAPWVGGVRESPRKLPQPRETLGAGETLSMRWQTEGRHLKNRVTDPNAVQDPTFPFAGLYSVHATLDVITTTGTVRLRSNEQLVAVGGSRVMPKYTRGPVLRVDGEKRTATLGLGSLHKVRAGDEFEIGHPKGKHWRLTVTDVMQQTSEGKLEMLTRSTFAPYREPPEPMSTATLVMRETK